MTVRQNSFRVTPIRLADCNSSVWKSFTMWLLAQYVDDFEVYPVPPHAASWWNFTIWGTSITTIIYFAFWLWMLLHCLRTEPDKYVWIWVILVIQVVGPLLYFFMRFLPSTELRTPKFLRRWTRSHELTRLETAALQIGNPHQFTQWGDALRETGNNEAAANAYAHALKKDPGNLPALWGAALSAKALKQFDRCRDLTQQILNKDPQYKFGDVSLLYGKALVELGDQPAAIAHFEEHVRRWRQPEAVYALANMLSQAGQFEAARKHLQAMILDINGSPAAIARRNGRWKSRAKQLLKKLPV